MESIKKLRERGKIRFDEESQDPRMMMVALHPFELIELADKIEAEVAERYMLRPCDMDGVPIKIGDELSHDGFAHNFIVHSYELIDGAWAVWDVANGAMHICSACHHVQPRMIEDARRTRQEQ